jgi:hypothetical protein
MKTSRFGWIILSVAIFLFSSTAASLECLAQQQYTVWRTCIVATTEELYRDYLNYQYSGDREARNRFIIENYPNLTLLEEGTVVYLLKTAYYGQGECIVKIRPKGKTATCWVVRDALI